MKIVQRDGVAVQDEDGRIIIDGEKEEVLVETSMPAFAIASLKNFLFKIKGTVEPNPVDQPAEDTETRDQPAGEHNAAARSAVDKLSPGDGAGVVSEPGKSESKPDAGVVSKPEKSQTVDGSGVS